MSDVLTKAQRAYCMSQNKAKDTKPEILLRKALWKKGLRYRLKNKLPGRPDIIFPKRRLAIFVDGCFWHGCPEHYQSPNNRSEYWHNKLIENRERDIRSNSLLEGRGWTVIRVWEHEVTSHLDQCVNRILKIYVHLA